MTRRLQRALAREAGGSVPQFQQADEERCYHSDSGFTVFWDFVTGLPELTEKIQVIIERIEVLERLG